MQSVGDVSRIEYDECVSDKNVVKEDIHAEGERFGMIAFMSRDNCCKLWPRKMMFR